MKKLGAKDLLLIGITLFSMFFGAGNLIFPPFMAFEAGKNAVPAFAGFVFTAVIFPVLGVAAVAKAGGIDKLCEKVHPAFGKLFTLLVYMCIGPFLAIPRTAGTSYAMFGFITDKAGTGTVLGISVQLLISIAFSVVFFAAAGYLARKPAKLKDVIGKRMTPVLLILILAMFAASLFNLDLSPVAPTGKYSGNALMAGFVDGYQTMDTLAAMVFGIVIALNIKALGVEENKDISKVTIKAGVIAGIVLATVYGILAYMGAKSGTIAVGSANGTDILTVLCARFFGAAGPVIIAAIFFFACFNVCTGLLASCAEYFSENFKFMNFDKWLLLFTVWSFVISNMGLDAIISLSSPILSLIYPVAIIIIILNFIPAKFVQTKLFYRTVVTITLIGSFYSVFFA